jgi:ComF family protein
MNPFDLFLDIFFPKNCVFCGTPESWLCDKCFSKIVLVKSPSCPNCKTLMPDGKFCSHCCRKSQLSGIMISAYYEEGPLREAICSYKYKFIKELADPLSNLLISHLQEHPLPPEAILVPVPLHKSRLRQRGFNQAAILAEKVSEVFGLEYNPDILVRIRKTKPQVELSGKARRENIKGAFSCQKPNFVKGKNIILIDDVCTTGATLEGCAAELKEANASKVWGLVLARQ